MKYLLLWLFLVATICPSHGQINKPNLISNFAFNRAVKKNIHFPSVAQRLGKSVRVYVSFTLTDKGSYENVAVVNHGPVDESFKQEVDRLWHILPNQDPAYAGNYVIPISFMLGENGPNRLKPISNQDDTFTKQDTYVLLDEVSVIGYLVCELRSSYK